MSTTRKLSPASRLLLEVVRSARKEVKSPFDFVLDDIESPQPNTKRVSAVSVSFYCGGMVVGVTRGFCVFESTYTKIYSHIDRVERRSLTALIQRLSDDDRCHITATTSGYNVHLPPPEKLVDKPLPFEFFIDLEAVA